MKKRMSDINNLSIKHKLFIAYSLLIVCTTMIISLIVYLSAKSILVKTNQEYTLQISGQISRNVDSILTDMNSLASLLLYNDDVIQYLYTSSAIPSETRETRETLDAYYKISSFFATACAQNANTSAISLYPPDSLKTIAVDQYEFSPSGAYPGESLWYQELMYTDDMFKTTFLKISDGSVVRICLGRKLVDMTNGKTKGILVVENDVENIARMLDNYTLSSEGMVQISDQNGDMVYSTNASLSAEYRNLLHDTDHEPMTGTTDDALVSTQISSDYGWRTTCIIPMEHIEKQAQTLLPLIAMSSLIILLIVICVIYYIARNLTKPLKIISDSVAKVSKGNFDIRIPINRTDEIGLLAKAINTMIVRIKSLIHTTYTLELHHKDAELKMLQAQINPHFLQNTLESIRTIAVINNDYMAAQAIVSLGRHMNLKLSSSAMEITIKEEIEHVSSYFHIVKLQQSNALELDINADPNLYSHRIVKLTLQPIVENAVVHAFKQTQSGGTITLEAKAQEDTIQFSILDNGRGIPPRCLEELRDTLAKKTPETTDHIGLSNVNRRLCLFYGDQAALQIDNRTPHGTVVRFRIPIFTGTDATKGGGLC